MQEAYRSYLVTVKKIVDQHDKTHERLVQLETLVDQDKKALLDTFGIALFVDPEDETGSGDDEATLEEPFVGVNRDLAYLKQSMLDYLHEENLKSVAAAIDTTQWVDYTDVALKSNQSKNNQSTGKEKLSQKSRQSRRTKKRISKTGSTQKTKKRNYIPAKRDQSDLMVPAQRDMVFFFPIERSHYWLSSRFGPRKKSNGTWGFHHGVDMAACKGTLVKAAAAGVVTEARYASGYGNVVVIAHNKKYKTRYAHLSAISTYVGQEVKRGQLIGKVGDTGCVRKSGKDASHLHFEVVANGKRVNPMYFLM